jgi:hypothetical protein
MRLSYRVAAAAAATILAASLFAACSDDDDAEGSGAAGSTLDVVSAIDFIDGAGLHGIDVSINEEDEIPASAASTARKVQAVTLLAAWPADLQGAATTLAGIFGTLAEALEAEEPDMAAAGEAAKNAHDAQHDFSHDVWAYLQEEAGIEAHGDDGHE